MISPREVAGVAGGYGRKSQEAAESCLPTLPIFLLLFLLQPSSATHRALFFQSDCFLANLSSFLHSILPFAHYI